jgi:DNA-binding beta-propeller fold protein YncE
VQRFDPSGAYLGAAGSPGKGPGQFGFTYGVALDAAGDVYVADDLNHRIVKLDPNLAFLGAWGGYGPKPGQLAYPRALASDPAGDTYVADTANGRIEVFDPSGEYLRAFGVSGRAPGEMTAPDGVAADPTGRLLVADADGSRVELFAPSSAVFSGQWSATGGYRPSLLAPAGIGVDPRGSVFVADAAQGRLTRWWGDGTFLGELGGPAATGGASLARPSGVAVAAGSGALYVADSLHNRVLVYGPEGGLQASWGAGGGSGAAGSGPGQFSNPRGVAADPGGNVWVADTANNRIVELSPTGAELRAFGGNGEWRLRAPIGVAVDARGAVYVVDSANNRVVVFDAAARPLARWGLRGTGAGEFSQPTAIAVACDGSVYVADTNDNRVERFDAAALGGGCVGSQEWPPPLDVAPKVTLALLRGGGVLARRGLAVALRCERSCRVLVTASLAPRRPGRPTFPLVARALALRAGAGTRLHLPLGPRSLRRLRRALGPGRLLTARITVVAAGPTGRRTTVTQRFAVGR